MAGFCYFIEGDLKSINLEKIAELGLAYAFDSAPACRESGMQNPSNSRGLFFADSRRLGDLAPGYYPDLQEWREMPTVEGRPRLFIGYWNDHKPTPKDLQREKLVDGLMVKLGDGLMWQVPEICEYSELVKEWECRLPSYLDFDMSGKVIKGRPVGDYLRLWDAVAPLASRIMESEAAGQESDVTDQELADAVALLLGANYAVTFPELSVLRLLTDTGDMALILAAACKKKKLLSWLDVQKKSEYPPTSTG